MQIYEILSQYEVTLYINLSGRGGGGREFMWGSTVCRVNLLTPPTSYCQLLMERRRRTISICISGMITTNVVSQTNMLLPWL